MFDFDPICDCGNKVVDNIWPCKHCGRPDPRNRIVPGREIILRTLNKRCMPRFGPEISLVWNPYFPGEDQDGEKS
jgi:hypothetical protein